MRIKILSLAFLAITATAFADVDDQDAADRGEREVIGECGQVGSPRSIVEIVYRHDREILLLDGVPGRSRDVAVGIVRSDERAIELANRKAGIRLNIQAPAAELEDRGPVTALLSIQDQRITYSCVVYQSDYLTLSDEDQAIRRCSAAAVTAGYSHYRGECGGQGKRRDCEIQSVKLTHAQRAMYNVTCGYLDVAEDYTDGLEAAITLDLNTCKPVDKIINSCFSN